MYKPLAEVLRPQKISQIIGQEHLVGKGKPLRQMIESGKVSSMILWGPPGSGKTTLATVISNSIDAEFVFFSAVTSGVADVRKVIEKARELRKIGRKTILFVDEIHRFNKGQQDAFLPHVEDGTIVLIGATTENPGFRVNAPLLSRASLFVLKTLSDKDIKKVIQKALKTYDNVTYDNEFVNHLIKYSNGDARFAINSVEQAVIISNNLDLKIAEEAVQRKAVYYDKKGDYHYDTISAFIKSMRGSDPDAALHYLARMIKAGEDPLFIARRMVIFASEDIGNAQPTALVVAVSTMQAVTMIGMPESQLILAQCATYLASAKKSISSTEGLFSALNDVEMDNLPEIPFHLRNASNKVMKSLGYGEGHVRYAWKEERETGKKAAQEYMPTKLRGKKYYKRDW